MRGSVVQKPVGSGRWDVVVEMDRDPGTGARRRKWHSGFSSKRDAERGLTKILTSLDQVAYLSPTRVTVASYLTQTWLPAIESTVRPTTFSGYRAHINLYVVPQLGAGQLQRLTPRRRKGRRAPFRRTPLDASTPPCIAHSVTECGGATLLGRPRFRVSANSYACRLGRNWSSSNSAKRQWGLLRLRHGGKWSPSHVVRLAQISAPARDGEPSAHADERTWVNGWGHQFRLAATQASMDSRTVSVTVCFGRKPRTVRALSIEYMGARPM